MILQKHQNHKLILFMATYGAEADAQRHRKNETRVKVKVILQQAEVAQGIPGRLRHRIILTFGFTRVLGPQP